MLNEVDPAANRSTANGSTTVFAYTFKITLKTDIEVLVDLVVKTVDVDYTVDGLGVSGGGNVTFFAAPANNTVVTRLRKQPASQLSDYVPNEAFPSDRIEADLDKLAMQIQQLKEQARRGFFLPKSSALVDQGIAVPTVGAFARGKSGGGIDWATPTAAGPLSSPVAIADGGTGATTAAGARTNLLVYSENTLVDAKGDLLIGASDNTLARLAPPATTGFVPTYDPSATNFISWGPRAQPNPIINGTMEIWQRGTTFAGIAGGTVTYTADRWKLNYNAGAAVVTINRSTNVPSVAQAGVLFNYSLEIDVTTADAAIAAGDQVSLIQAIEGYNWRQYAQRALTLSFWVSSTKTGIHCAAVTNHSDRSYVVEYTVNVADTWEYKTATITASPSAGTWNYTNTVGLGVAFQLMGGSTYQTTKDAWQNGVFYGTSNQVNVLDNVANFFRITGVKLELGSVATPIQFVPFEAELARAQRYYEKSFDYITAPAQNVNASPYKFIATTAGAVSVFSPSIPYKIIKRSTTPTITLFNPFAANAQIRNSPDGVDLTGSTAQNTGDSMFTVFGTGNAGMAVGEALIVHWACDAEL